MDITAWIMAIGGLITAVATVVLVLVTWRYTKINRDILKSNEKTSNEQLRPYVIAHIFSEDECINFQIKNIGKRPAYNAKISINPSLQQIEKLDQVVVPADVNPHEHLLNQEFIPPDFEISTVLSTSKSFVLSADIPSVYSAQVTYYDLNGKLYSENYTMNLGNYIYRWKIMKITKKYFIQNIKENIQEINKSLKTIANKN
ncbi:MAG: hypothetical protein WCR42_00460 [bacterium]